MTTASSVREKKQDVSYLNNVSLGSSFELKVEKTPVLAEESKGYTSKLKRQFFRWTSEGNLSEMRKCLLKYPDLVHATDSEGNTPLHIAVLHLKTDVIQLLSEYKADLNASNPQSMTPLHFLSKLNSQNMEGSAPTKKQLRTVLKLLISLGANIKATDYSGCNLLHLAVAEGNHSLMRVLIRGFGFDVHEMPKLGQSNLIKAIENDDEIAIRILVERGADLNCALTYEIDFQTMKPHHTEVSPIQFAIKRARSKSTLALLSLGAQIPSVPNPFNPLIGAIEKGMADVAYALIDKGVSPNGVGNLSTPLLAASRNLSELEKQLATRSRIDVALRININKMRRLVEFLKERDHGVTDQFLSSKFLALRFGIGGNFNIGESSTASDGLLSGMIQSHVFPILASSVHSFFNTLDSSLLSDEQKERVLKAIEKAPERAFNSIQSRETNSVQNGYDSGEIVLGSCGWTGHETDAVVCKTSVGTLFVKANRGEMCGDFPGAIIYTADKPFNHSAERVLGIFARDPKDGFLREIDTVLDLKKLAYLPLPTQPSGNCPWASPEAAFLGALFITLYIDNGAKQSVDIIKERALSIYNDWERFDRAKEIRSILNQDQTLSLPDYQLLAKIFVSYNGDDKVKQELRNYLLKAPIDWAMVDKQGRSLAHFAAVNGNHDFLDWAHQNKLPIPLGTLDWNHNTPLHLAIEKGHTLFATKIVQMGAPLEETSNMMFTPLVQSILFDRYEIFEALLKAGADPNKRCAVGTPMDTALMVQSSKGIGEPYIVRLMQAF